jgi:hypothetical protein
MPDRISPGIIRTQVVFQGASQLPEDRFINTFHFRHVDGSPGIDSADLAEIDARLTAFYNTPGPSGNSISKYLSGEIVKTSEAAQFRSYDLGEAHPREPHITTWTPAATADAARLPTEVAICGSFYGSRNIPRQRGRVYIGPLALGALDQSTGRPHSAARVAIAESLEYLAESGTLLDWVAYSTVNPAGSSVSVTDGWVDNAFDTQRRRGIEATARTVWTATPS